MRVSSLSSLFIVLSLSYSFSNSAQAGNEQCGRQAGGKVCPNGLCCSASGYCGNTAPYCGDGCQSNCWGSLTDILSEDDFHKMTTSANNPSCPGHNFYTYKNFLMAAESYHDFGNVGNNETRKREIAAFFGQTSHETSRYCYVNQIEPPSNYCCKACEEYPCFPGAQYYGRGPMQLRWNYNYGQLEKDFQLDFLENPGLLADDGVIAFESALWAWMTPLRGNPSPHQVITGQWKPSEEDTAANRLPGYGVIINLIRGHQECGRGPQSAPNDRIAYFKAYCDIYNISYGDNLDCEKQKPFPSSINDMECTTIKLATDRAAY